MKRFFFLMLFFGFLSLITSYVFAKEWSQSLMTYDIECNEAQELAVLENVKSPRTISLVYTDQFVKERAKGVKGIIVTSDREKPEFPQCNVNVSKILDFCNDPTNRACIPVPAQYLEEDLEKVKNGTFLIERINHPRFPTPLY
ncbi:MAG: hypothetical protein JSS34_04460 [Proteobacteria bacterium]|nr:hypothetical protein [Pseudomonadota bacterium]